MWPEGTEHGVGWDLTSTVYLVATWQEMMPHWCKCVLGSCCVRNSTQCNRFERRDLQEVIRS
jgi:hypothetical protein